MGKNEKLKARLARKPKDFRFSELCALLHSFGYELEGGGKTGGSRRRFFSEKTGRALLMHEPHPSGILKPYQINEVLTFLREEGCL